MEPTPGTRRLAASLLVVAVGAFWWWAMLATTTSPEHDPFESPLSWWSWLVLPATAFVAAAIAPARWTALGWLAVAPLAVGTLLGGTVFHDPDDGASLWMVGEVVVLVEGAVCSAGAALGRTLRAVPVARP
jgi:hypothetical protein